MFEYIYFRDLALLLMLWLALSLVSATYKTRYTTIYAALFVLIWAFFQNLYLSNVFKNNMELYNKDEKLECQVDKNKYLV